MAILICLLTLPWDLSTIKTFVKGLRGASGRPGSPSPPSNKGMRFGISLSPGGGGEVTFVGEVIEVSKRRTEDKMKA